MAATTASYLSIASFRLATWHFARALRRCEKGLPNAEGWAMLTSFGEKSRKPFQGESAFRILDIAGKIHNDLSANFDIH